MTEAQPTVSGASEVPRSIGTLRLSVKNETGVSTIDRLRTSGSTKAIFPRSTDAVEVVLLNTGGGLTGGDRFEHGISAGRSARATVTSQAAERAYRSTSGSARIRTTLSVEEAGVLHWLPQELIVFDGASVRRLFEAEVAEMGELLLVEPIVFGRTAMGETVNQGRLEDTIVIRRCGDAIYRDRVALTGPIATRLGRLAVTGGALAVATIIFVSRRAMGLLGQVRGLLPVTGGASCLSDGLMTVRLVAEDSFAFRASMIPILEVLSGRPLPRTWRL